MRLHINFVPVIVTILALMTVVGLREESWPRFVAEYNQPIYTPPAPPVTVGIGPGSADSLPAFVGCQGPMCGAFQQYRIHGVRHWDMDTLHSTSISTGSRSGSLRWIIEQIQSDSSTSNKPLDIVTASVGGDWEWAYLDAGRGTGAIYHLRGVFFDFSNAPGNVTTGRWTGFQINDSEDVIFRGFAVRGARGEVASYQLRAVASRRIGFTNMSVSHGPQRQFAVYSDTTIGSTGEAGCMRYWQFDKTLMSYKARWAGLSSSLDPDSVYSDPPTTTMATGLPRGHACTTDGAWTENAIVGLDGSYRTPNMAGRNMWVVGNWIYNIGGNPWIGNNNGYFSDITHNYFDAGPETSASSGSDDWWPIYTDTLGSCSGGTCYDSLKSLYVHKNMYDQSSSGDWGDTALSVDSIFDGSRRYVMERFSPGTPIPVEHRRFTPLAATFPFPIDSPATKLSSYQTILDSAGAGRRIDSLGNPFMLRDTVDTRARNAVLDGVQYKQEGDLHRDSFRVTFYPDFTANNFTPCRDTDGDTMCDAWEVLASGSIALVDTAIQASGYSALELFNAGGITNIDTVIGVAPPPDPDEIPAIPGGVGEGAVALQSCRDSVLNGSWGPPVIHVVRGTSYDSAFADGGIMDILQNDLSDTKLDIVMFSEAGGMVNVQDTAGAPDRYMLNIDNSCVIVTGVNSPGDGVVFRTNLPDRDMLFRIGRYNTVSDILVGDIRVWADSGTGSHVPPFAAGGDSRLLYIHHNSFHHGQDQIGLGASHATFAFNIVANISDGHNGATETLWMTQWEPDDGPDSTIAQSYIGNFLAHHMWRIPSLKAEGSVSADSAREYTGRWKWTNNISWKYADAGDEISHFAGGVELDITNSIFAYFKNGPEPNSFTPISWLKCIDLNNTNSDCTSDGGPAGWLSPASVRISGTQYRELGVVEATDYDMARSFNNEVLPDSIKRGSAISDPDFPYTPLTADQAHDSLTSLSVRYGVGASRQLSCSGVLSARRDLTDAEIIGHYVASDSTTEEEMRNSWGSSYVVRDSMTDAGTPCADTDGDKLPDAYEKLALDDPNDSTSLTTVDVAPNTGHLAIEMYLEGYSFDASGGGDPDPPEPGGPARTYGDTRGAYLVPLVVELDTIGSGGDTMILQRYVPDRDSVPLGYAYSYYIVSGRDSILVMTYDTITEIGFGVRDSSAVDSILADMGFTYPPYPWSVWVPGAP